MYETFFEQFIQRTPNSQIEWICFLGVPSLILLAGIIDDLRSKKVHNKLILALFPLAILSQLIGFGLSGLAFGALAFVLALSLTAPMTLAGMLGGGDMKLFAVFAMSTNMNVAIWVGLASIIWGGLFGVFKALISGQGLVLVTNTLGILKRQKPNKSDLTTVPYTIALGFGWMTYLSLSQVGRL